MRRLAADFPGPAIPAALLRDYAFSSSREWLITNGLGGYASASLSGANTRRYHGLLVAALDPPTGRRVLLSRIEETLQVGGASYDLATNQYPGTVHPEGYRTLAEFRPWPAPTFLFAPAPGVVLRKRIWLAHGRSTTYIAYTLLEAPDRARLRLTPLLCWKDYHAEMRETPGFPTAVRPGDGGIAVDMVTGAPVLRLLAPACYEPAGYWHRNIEHLRELERGFDWHEDLYCAGHLVAELEPGATLTVVATVEQHSEPADLAWRRHVARQAALLRKAGRQDGLAAELSLAAGAFIVEGAGQAGHGSARRPGRPRGGTRATIIAGYPWFADWGRDTMIALPGLCLATGRHGVARDILRGYGRFVSQGMLPNRFPDEGGEPEYNTVDAALWYVEAARQYAAAAPDGATLLRQLWPVLEDIVTCHVRGTRYGVGADPADGLLQAGAPGVQLTWMDARVDGWVVTPRAGKPVEVNALWHNALRSLAWMAARLGRDGAPYRRLARQVAASFQAAFVRPDGLGLYDVLTESGPDPAIRPNQVFAVSLPYSPLSPAQQKTVVDVVASQLVVPGGVRTLAPDDPAYHGRYAGGPCERDGAYHQGTAWPWLLGPFSLAHLRVYGDRAAARAYLEPLRDLLTAAGVGYLPEVLDGDPPHRPGGCIAQAWSVAEALRAWRLLS